ncbi:MAG TPA: hypothetical protein VK486_16090 [Thermoleophilaceae bacterium]|nr:hypothetical protein [Thermoleophilaceae bacterium]
MNTTKAYLAGIGTTGILVGSIAVLLVLGSGLAAFDGLPDLAQRPAPLDRVVLREHRPGAGDRSRGAARRQARRAAARRQRSSLVGGRRAASRELAGGAPGAGTPGDGGPGGGAPGGGSPVGGSPGGGSPGGGGADVGGDGSGGSPLPPALHDAVSGVTDSVVGALERLAPGAGAPAPGLGSQPRDALRR